MNLPIFKIIPRFDSLTEIALVQEPAIEEEFIYFQNEVKLEFNSEQRIITGPIMIPDKLIYRNDSLGERYVTYDSTGIKMAAEYFFKNGAKFNEGHSDKHNDLTVIESYFVKEGGIYPKGTWIISARVNDDNVWNSIKEDKFTGFSFQSMFTNVLVQKFEQAVNTEESKLMEDIEKSLNELEQKLSSIYKM